MNNVNKLRISALMLYWAEGTKKGSNVDFTNSDYKMAQLWIKFLREICKVDEKRLKLQLHLHYDMNEPELKKWWSKKLNIPLKNFTKSYIKKVKKKGTYKIKSYVGTIKIRYSSKSLLNKINTEISQLWHEFNLR